MRATISILTAAITLVAAGPAAAQAPTPDAPPAEPAPPEPTPVEPAPIEATPTAAVSAEPPPVEPPLPAAEVEAKPSRPWTDRLTLGAGLILWYYQPLDTGGDSDFSLFWANLVVDGKFGKFGVHVDSRFRPTKLRPFFDGPTWVEEAYAHVGAGPLTVKVGKLYSRLGLFWDGSFYGNVQVYDGLKLAPDFGVSVEGVAGAERPQGVRYWGQYFVVDGATNVSLPGRDTISIAGARRRNEVVARVEPFTRLGGGGGELKLGVSGQFLQADLPAGVEPVYRAAVDASVTRGGFSAWAEVLRQWGKHVDAFPVAATPATDTMPAVPGRASELNDYLLVGGQYQLGKLVGRYNVSYGGYRDESVREWLHVPAIGYAASDNLSVLSELVVWTRNAAGTSSTFDRSLNVTVNGHF